MSAGEELIDPEKIRASLTDEEKRAHETLRELLWVQYPSASTIHIDPADDKLSDVIALLIMNGLRVRGFTIVAERDK